MRQRTTLNTILTVLVCLFAIAGTGNAKTIYVDGDAAGANDGSSWADAYNYLQDALADANSSPKPVEIHVAQGVYKPDRSNGEPNGAGDREATFQLISGVTLKGGYAGFGEPDPNARKIELYETILNGDLGGNDVNNVSGSWWQSREENSCHVVTGSYTKPCATLDGFHITAGIAMGFSPGPNSRGAGMYNNSGSPTVTNCKFSENLADLDGAGMYNHNSNPKVTNCTFGGYWGHWAFGSGGGMCNVHSSPKVTECTFSGVAAGLGGGIYNSCYSNPVIRNCKIAGRGQNGGGIACDGESAPLITNCTLGGLAYEDGGAIYCIGGSSPLITNCVIGGCADEGAGGGLACLEGSSPTIGNCTFVGNSALGGPGAAIYCGENSDPLLTNSIVWGSICNSDSIHGLSRITYSYIDGDPLFADPNNGDYHLKSQAGRWDANSASWVKDDVTSLCIDAGDPMSPIGNEPFPNGGIINMGAYGGTAEASKSYFGKPPCETIVAGDINGDCEVNFLDFRLLALHWLEEH